MRRARLFGCAAAALSLLLLPRCASRRDPLPTIEDYSDGVSTWAETFLEDWRAGVRNPALYAPQFRWSGPLPGDELVAVPTRPPLVLRAFRAGVSPDSLTSAAREGDGSSEALRRRLAEIRSGFATLGRTENTIFEFFRRGAKREVTLGLLLTGKDRSGSLRQEGGKLRAILTPDLDGSWRLETAALLNWISASASLPLYEDVGDRAGLTRVHRAFRPLAAKSIPIPGEHFPPGVAVLDFDGDGREELFVPGGDGNRLYRNMGSDPRRGSDPSSDPSFVDVAEKAGVAGQNGEGIGALAFDYDDDGDQDLYVTYLLAPNLLYENRGDGTFAEVGAKAGVALNDYSTSAAALDYDRDGDADLYVLVYGRPGRGPNVPANNAPPNRLFRNEGNGRFSDVSKASGTDHRGWGLALQSADLDGDLWPDLYVANDFGVNAYYRNNRDGTFTDLAGRAGVKDAGFGMGVTVDDYDGDGRLDFYVSNYSYPLNWFLRDRRFPMPGFPYSLFRPLIWRRLKALSRGSSLFRPAEAGGFERTSDDADVWNTLWSWGCVFVDGDLDGRADLFVVNGMATGRNPREREVDFWNLMSREYRKMEKGIATSDFGDDSLAGRPPKRFYRNLDGRRFAEIAAVTGLESTANQRGAVVFDAEGDGDPDLFATGFLQPPALSVNRNPSGARTLVLTLQGLSTAERRHRSTRDALGAVVTVEAGGLRRAQVVSAGYSFLSSGSKSLFFGLGDRDRADRVTIRWPSGKVSELKDVAAGKLLLCEPPGDATTPIVR